MGVWADISRQAVRTVRDCTLSILNAAQRRQSLAEVEANFDALPKPARLAICTATVVTLFALSLIFAQAGLLGIGIYLLLVFLIIK